MVSIISTAHTASVASNIFRRLGPRESRNHSTANFFFFFLILAKKQPGMFQMYLVIVLSSKGFVLFV